MKYNNSDLAEVWASQTEKDGQNGGSTFFFEGEAIYSYGYHFKIARLIPVVNLVLFTSNECSATTGQHKGLVRRALGGRWRIVEVHDVEAETEDQHYSNYKECIEDIEELICKAKHARKYTETYLDHAEQKINALLVYIESFDIKNTKVLPFYRIIEEVRGL